MCKVSEVVVGRNSIETERLGAYKVEVVIEKGI
jgi:hypothetical protein